ncbi:hypothetical protein GE061_007517 [Apolygus lucorum]|uniref:Peptidase S1 domain-containing protein n=1 Tax=Apolygus lucorum TaxID=248454 RepID=A0A8S9WTN9_APOLU|nr:hypothetical protein GE061_007517 [Apolygus lucorum]
MTKNHETCVTMGWGLDAEGYESSLLKVLTVTLRPGSWCKEKILNITKDQDGGPEIFGPSDSLCALGCEEGETVCAGDSGAPLLCGPNRVLVGVVSYGPGNASCGNDKIPFVYARVDGWETWIWAVIFNTSLHPHDSASIMNLHPCIMATLAMVIIIKEKYLET